MTKIKSIFLLIISISIFSSCEKELSLEKVLEGEWKVTKMVSQQETVYFTAEYMGDILQYHKYKYYFYFNNIVNNKGTFYSKITILKTVEESDFFPLYEATDKFHFSKEKTFVIKAGNKIVINKDNYQIININENELVLNYNNNNLIYYLTKD